MPLSDRVVAFLGRAKRFILPAGVPEPPPLEKTLGGYALFMDEDEREIVYAKSLIQGRDGPGVPFDERTNSATWLLGGHGYAPSRRDEFGNWIFRRMPR